MIIYLFILDEVPRPHLPNHGYGFDGEDYEQEHKRHGKKHHHCHKGHHGHRHHRNGTFSDRMHQAKCWYKSLSWKSKILLFSVGFFGLLTAVICCGMCCKRRKARKVIFDSSQPVLKHKILLDNQNLSFNEFLLNFTGNFANDSTNGRQQR